MLSVQRRARILAILESETAATVRDLAQRLSVAESTIRRDLDKLEQQNCLTRTYGGAICDRNGHDSGQRNYDVLANTHRHNEKARIGERAAQMIHDYEAVFLDSGTTIEAMLPYLTDREGVTVVTCSLRIAMELAKLPHVTTIIVGGQVHSQTLSATGLLALRAMEAFQLHSAKAFIGVRGVTAGQGLTNRVSDRIPVKQLAMAQAREVIVVADGSKVGALAPSQVAPLSAVDCLITDTTAPPGECDAIRATGVEVLVV